MLNNTDSINFYNPDYPVNWLVISDLHILPKEPKNRKNLIPNIITLLNELIEIGVKNKIDGILFLGDIFDRSFSSVSTNYLSEIIDIFKRMSEKFDLFAVFGNHELTYYKDNPYYMITDIKSETVLKQLKDKEIPKPIASYIKVIDNIDYGSVIINFIHFNKENKLYKTDVPDGKINICLYHDALVNFESEQKLYHHSIGYGINVLKTDIFENVDWAICGDTHTPLNTITLNNPRNTTFDVPGVMTIRTTADTHTKVKCPVISLGNKGLLKQYITLNIGDYESTTDIEKVEIEKEKRELNKVLKKSREDIDKSLISYDNYIRSISDTRQRELLSLKPYAVSPDELDYNSFLMASEKLYDNIINRRE